MNGKIVNIYDRVNRDFSKLESEYLNMKVVYPSGKLMWVKTSISVPQLNFLNELKKIFKDPIRKEADDELDLTLLRDINREEEWID